MFKPRFTLPALLTALTFGLGLAACDADSTFDARLTARALEIGDQWDSQGPTINGDFASCDAFWAERCAGLSAAACAVAQNRLICSPDPEGVAIADAYWTEVSTPVWRGVDVDGNRSPASDIGAPQGACEGLSAADPDACLRIADIAGHLYENLATYTKGSPAGGLGRLINGKGGAKIVGSIDPKSGDLVLGAADQLGWSAPLLAGAALDGGLVIEDNLIFSVRPNGTISLSSGDVVLMIDDNHWDDCVECDGTIDMPIEEYILIDG